MDKENLAHLRTFYAACMDEGAQEEVGRRPLLEAVEEIVSAWRGVDAELLEEGASEGEEEEDSQVEEETGGEELVMEVDSTGEMIWKKKKKNKHYGKKHDKKHDKKRRGRKGGRWYDPETKKERLTNTLMWMHSRCESTGESETRQILELTSFHRPQPCRRYSRSIRLATLVQTPRTS